jgi:hypothetical protein
MTRYRAATVLMGAAVSLPCAASDTLSGLEWSGVFFLVALLYVIPVYALCLIPFLALRRTGRLSGSVAPHLTPFALVAIAVGLLWSELMLLPVVIVWLGVAAGYAWILARWGARNEAR